ncbi:structure-specific endonuclease subunit SLX4 isoform X2 [Lethenteron reissneri]|uniref:structure-specific endonuclease subunit SLX4 isoform X2 n=1 Tax=Lethenteron reissneri TaxID=7753 RepID=UPI002AB6752C|nr:structure-specific endonuclease subunit SLX4 isoform X2 [Lethenteron reissneri]
MKTSRLCGATHAADLRVIAHTQRSRRRTCNCLHCRRVTWPTLPRRPHVSLKELRAGAMMTDPITFPSSEPGRMGRSNGMALSASSSCGWDSEDDDFDSASTRCGPPAPKCLGKDRKLSRRNNTRGAALAASHDSAAAAASKTPAAGATAWEDGSSSRGVEELPGPDMECARGRRAEEYRQKPEDASVSAEAKKRRVARNPAEVSDLPGGSPGNVGAEHVARVATAADGHEDVALDDRRLQPVGDHSAGTGKATAEHLVQAPSTAGLGAGTGDEAAAVARSGERSPKPGGENLREAEVSRADSVAKQDGIVASPSATQGAREGVIGETRLPLPAPIPPEPHRAADDGDSDGVIVVAEWTAGKTAAASVAPSTSVDVADKPRPRVKDLVLENLQKYRWQAPERIQLSPDSGTASVLSDEQLARVLQQQEEEERLLLLAPGLEYAPLGDVPSGLCFCHVCQKELTHMNSVRRQQHINRCLDDQEQLGPGQAPASAGGAGVAAAAGAAVPECPICGRHFQTEKARAGHLKRCARELHVASRDLVLAVQRQQAQAGTAAPPAIATAAAGRALGAAPRRKKDKTRGSTAVRGRGGGGGLPSERPPPTDEEEQMRVALAMSASLMELEERAPPRSTGLLQPKPLRDKAAPKKVRRKKNADAASALLQADPAATVRRLTEKMAVLLVPDTELEQEVASRRTPPLPPSRLLLPSPASSSVPAPPPWCGSVATALLWKRSALLTADLQGEAPFLCPALVPPLSPGGPVPTGEAQKQLSFSDTITDAPANPVGDRVSLRQTPQDSSLRNSQPGLAEGSVGGCAGDVSRGGGGCGIGGTGGGGGSSASELGRSGEWQQEEVSGSQTLLALVELAREGLPLTQFMQDLGEPILPSCTGAIEEMSGFLPETEPCVSPCSSELHGAGPAQHSSAGPSLLAARLVADLSEMVNNPHMSDVQLQVDTGELAYAHMFMLYARCPALMQQVFTEGFDAVCERGEAQGRRVIVHDASLDAVLALLHFVYTGSLHVAPSALSETRALADRFELSDLLSACASPPVGGDGASPPVSGGGGVSPRPSYSGAAREGDAAIRELLRSLWEHEEEEEEEDGGRDGEAVKARRHDDDDDGDGGGGDDDDGIGDSDLDEVYEFVATQRRACGGRHRGSADAASERLGSNSDSASGLDGEEEAAAAAAASVKDRVSDASAARSPRANDTFAGGSSSEAGTVAGAAVASASSGPDDSYERMFTEEDASSEYVEPSPVTPSARRPLPRAFDVCERAASTRPRPGTLGEGCDDPLSRSPYRFGPAASSPFRMKKRSPGRRRPTIGVDPHLQYSLCEAEHSHFDRSPVPRHPSPASVPPSPQRPSPVRQSPGVAIPHPVTPPCLTALSPGSPALLATPSANDTVPTSSPHATSNHPSPGRAGRSIARALRKQQRHLASEFDALLCAGGEDGPVHTRADEGGAVTPEPSSKFQATSSIGSSVSETSSVNLRLSTDSEIGSGEVSWLIPGTPGAASRSCGFQTLQSCLLPGARGASSPGPDHGHGHALIDLTLSPHEGSSYASLFSGGSSARDSGGARRRDEGTGAAPCPILDADDAPESAVIVLDDSLERSPTGEFLLPTLTAPVRDDRVISLAEIGRGSPERCSLGYDPRPDSRDLGTGRARVSTSAAGDSGGELSGRFPATPDELPQRTPQRDGVPLTSGSAASPWQSGCFARMELSLRERLLSRLAAPSFHTQDYDEDRLVRTQCAAAAADDGTAAAAREEPAASPPAPDIAFDSWNPGEEQLCGLGLGSPDSLAGATTPVHEARGAGRQLQAGSATPMPCYSDMETPHLKKELNRFGVRALPKRKMVLKLKEIYHYTHPGQDPNLDPGDRRAGAAAAVAAAQKRPRGRGRPPRSGQPAPTLPRPPVGGSTSEETAASSDAERQLQNQSQESTRSSRVSSSHTGEDSDSSGREEFADPTFLLEEGVSGDDEEDGGVTASQHALRAEEREAAVLAFIRSRPELHRAMLLYRPFELSELQCQMRQAGLRVPAAALLDILDALCVTFTMAGARRSKQSGRAKRGGRGGGAGRGSPGKRGKRKASVTSPRKAKRKKKDAPI